ncbi:MAG: hypothetical protein H6845_00385 [Alphaproteobacteria bacterium]|nr:MAG: hypothetical protein H6845_00385 [Alphaproteobacteria bacterium]
MIISRKFVLALALVGSLNGGFYDGMGGYIETSRDEEINEWSRSARRCSNYIWFDSLYIAAEKDM